MEASQNSNFIVNYENFLLDLAREKKIKENPLYLFTVQNGMISSYTREKLIIWVFDILDTFTSSDYKTRQLPVLFIDIFLSNYNILELTEELSLKNINDALQLIAAVSIFIAHKFNYSQTLFTVKDVLKLCGNCNYSGDVVVAIETKMLFSLKFMVNLPIPGDFARNILLIFVKNEKIMLKKGVFEKILTKVDQYIDLCLTLEEKSEFLYSEIGFGCLLAYFSDHDKEILFQIIYQLVNPITDENDEEIINEEPKNALSSPEYFLEFSINNELE